MAAARDNWEFSFNGITSNKRLEDMSPEEYRAFLDRTQTQSSRINELNRSTIGSRGTASGGSGVGVGASSESNSSGSSSSSSLFGSLGDISSLTEQARDLARFRLGLDQEQARFSRGLREEEAQADFGRNFRLADQQIGGQRELTNIQQSATTDRLQRQLSNQREMQDAGFNQQNLFRAQSAALALRGLR